MNSHPISLRARGVLAIALITPAWSVMTAAAPVPVSAPPSTYTHQSAPTLYVDVDGARIAYRRFGHPGGEPLVFFQHFAGNLDNWDPKIIDGLAAQREVILFDNAGVAGSTGQVRTTIEDTAKVGIDFLDALGVKKADLFGLSMGSFVAQEIAVERPDLVRRLILVGSGPRGGIGMATLTPEFQAKLAKKRAVPDELLVDVFFTNSEKSQVAGRAFLARVRARSVNRDRDVSDKVAPAQAAAIVEWGAPDAHPFDYLKAIRQPVLVVGGSDDLVFYTVNSFNLAQHLANATLIVFADSAHGSLYQYPDLFLQNATSFLNNQ
ncbi:alpha/beta hydrolase [Dyella sp. GSA-30]|uniref:alpha/beta fold hydrolase n=1 Tax=Dyella sp. GSA-30 TaxID=2994496 RepID=UPI002491373A|nr:alpha/beta hydrolase [Dyella sp. GSA-30]BDU21666.1 peroxidase [Dyella sp. GSA-30]